MSSYQRADVASFLCGLGLAGFVFALLRAGYSSSLSGQLVIDVGFALTSHLGWAPSGAGRCLFGGTCRGRDLWMGFGKAVFMTALMLGLNIVRDLAQGRGLVYLHLSVRWFGATVAVGLCLVAIAMILGRRRNKKAIQSHGC